MTPATSPRERPLLFTGAMVRVLLADRKTQTRRLNGLDAINADPDAWRYLGMNECGAHEFADRDGQIITVNCPYGQRGDLIWVRETWKPHSRGMRSAATKAIYRAEYSFEKMADALGPWRPSIFMPRWASRITLELTDVRVERLQDISEADARAEGCVPQLIDTDGLEGEQLALAEALGDGYLTAKFSYMELWDSINRKHPWSSNCWVWVLTFRRLEAKS